MQGRRQLTLPFKWEIQQGCGVGGRDFLLFFPSSLQNTSVPPISSELGLFTKGKHECCL